MVSSFVRSYRKWFDFDGVVMDQVGTRSTLSTQLDGEDESSVQLIPVRVKR